MASFPVLKTSAVAQYPATRTVCFRNQLLRFVNGTEQRYRDSAGSLRRWEIALDQLDEGEMASVARFFEECQGAFGRFEFTDPWDGKTYADCRLESDELAMTALGERNGALRLTVVENR